MFASLLTLVFGWRNYPVHSDETNGTIFVPSWWGRRRQLEAILCIVEQSGFMPGWNGDLPSASANGFTVTVWEYPEAQEDIDRE